MVVAALHRVLDLVDMGVLSDVSGPLDSNTNPGDTWDLLRPCPTPGPIRSLRLHCSSTAQLRLCITYSGHGRTDIPPLSMTLGLIPVQSLLHLTVYPALT